MNNPVHLWRLNHLKLHNNIIKYKSVSNRLYRLERHSHAEDTGSSPVGECQQNQGVSRMQADPFLILRRLDVGLDVGRVQAAFVLLPPSRTLRCGLMSLRPRRYLSVVLNCLWRRNCWATFMGTLFSANTVPASPLIP